MDSRLPSPIRRLLWCVLAAALAFATPVIALETIPDKPYGEEWRTVSPGIADTLPALDFWKTLDPKIPQKYFYYRPSLYLFVLRYPVTKVAEGDSREFRDAVKAFQRDLGSKPTGVLTVAQYITLEDRAAWLRTAWVDPWFGTPTIEPANLSSPMTTVLQQDEQAQSIGVAGLLTSDAVTPSRLLTMVRAECHRHSMICSTAAVAGNFWLSILEYDGPLVRASSPWAEVVTLNVVEWTDARIVAAPPSGDDATLCLVLLPQSGKAYTGHIAVVDPPTPPAPDPSRVPAGPGLLCAQDEELLPLAMPAEVQRRTEQIYGQATRTFVADWKAKDQEYQDAIKSAAEKRKASNDAAKAPSQ